MTVRSNTNVNHNIIIIIILFHISYCLLVYVINVLRNKCIMHVYKIYDALFNEHSTFSRFIYKSFMLEIYFFEINSINFYNYYDPIKGFLINSIYLPLRMAM